MTFQLDREGGAEVLKQIVADEIAALTQRIADTAGEGAEVKMGVTDRARGTVTVPAELQAKDGVLTKAAAALGLEVRPRKATPRKALAT
jgi:ethanolamine utilization microcompartment shell protein EutS